MLGTAAGLIGALTSISAKGEFNGVTAGTPLLANPLTYLTALLAAGVLVVGALAFRAGPLTASTPAMIAANPIAATAVSIWLFHQSINATPLDLALIVACIAVVGVGIVAITRSDAIMVAQGADPAKI